MMKYLFTYIILFLFATSLYAAGNIGVSSADFLELGTGTRAIGMGEAYTAMNGDLNAIYYNPASLSSLNYPELDISHQELIVDSRLENITASMPLMGGYFAVGETFFWVPPFDKIDIDGNKVGTVNFYNSNSFLSYSRNIGGLYTGATLKYIYQRIDTYNYHSAAIDFGILKPLYIYSPFKTPSKNFFIGTSISNIGLPINGNPLPRKFRAGLSYIPIDWMRINLDVSQYLIDVSDLSDFTYAFDESFNINTGLELNYNELLYFRSGYKFNDGNTYSFGAGMNYAIRDVAFRMDISYSDAGDFGSIYSMSFTFKLIPKVVTAEDKALAETYYRKAIKSYINDDLDSAKEYFIKTKQYNPYFKDIDSKIKDLDSLIKLKKQNDKREEQEKSEQNNPQ